MVAMATCGVLLGLTAPAASGAVDRTVYKCEGTATWDVTINLVGQSTAVRTLSGGIGVCKRIHARVEDDGNFSLDSTDGDTGPFANDRDLTGVGVTGVPVFAGVATSPSGAVGPIAIAGDSLAATMTSRLESPGSFLSVEVHTPDGKCGPTCWRTKAVWTGTYDDS